MIAVEKLSETEPGTEAIMLMALGLGGHGSIFNLKG